MSTESRRTKIEITSDPRLRAGVRAALEHICDRHGLGKEEQHELTASVENECANGAEANCAVIIDETDDHVEVTVAGKNSSGNGNSREANIGEHENASHSKRNGGGRIFVKHFQKNAARS